MNPEIVQLAAEHGTRSVSLFWGWEVALEMFLGGTAGALRDSANNNSPIIHDTPRHRRV
jgi:hypothetical protein